MSDYGYGSIATLLIDMHNNREETVELITKESIIYKDYIQSDEWKQKSKDAKERVGNRCQVCNGNDRLEAHHRTYLNLGNELPEDITILCHKCHELFSIQGKI